MLRMKGSRVPESLLEAAVDAYLSNYNFQSVANKYKLAKTTLQKTVSRYIG